MQTAFSLPRNEGFFQRYATLVPVLSKLGIFAQLVNGLTEFGILNALLLAHIAAFFGAYAFPVSIGCALVGVFILEMGQRTFLPYAARAVLYRRFAGLDLWMTLFIFGVTVCLFGASLYLSFAGSRDLVAATAPPPAIIDTDKADKAETIKMSEAETIYQTDTKEINARYLSLIGTTKAAYNAQINKERNEAQRYNNSRNSKITALQAECSAKVAELEAQKSGEISTAKTRRGKDTDEAKAVRQKVTTTNENATRESAVKVEAYGGGLGWLTVIFHLVLVLSFVLSEMHKKGSGIELKAAPNQYHFSESISAKFWNTVSDKWNYTTRTAIQKWADTTPPPPRPTEPPTLYELADYAPRRVMVQSTGGGQNTAPPDAQQRAYTVPFSANLRTDQNPTHSMSNAMSKAEITDTSLKPCAFCGTMYRPRTTWQKFCTSDCKLNEHEQRTGQRFDPNKVRFRRSTANT